MNVYDGMIIMISHATLGSASERAKGWGPVWANSGHSAQYDYHMLLARLGMGEGERADTSAGSRAWYMMMMCYVALRYIIVGYVVT